MLMGIVYFCFHLFPLRKKAGRSTPIPTPEKEQTKEADSHVLVSRSKAFIAPSIPKNPVVSSSEKTIENPNTFVGKNSPSEGQTSDEMEMLGRDDRNMEEGENEMQVAYTMDETDEEAVIREELQIADEAMPEITPTAILTRDLERVSRWSRKDDSLDEEAAPEVHDTLQSIRGTDLMEYMKQVILRQERDHQKLLTAIRKVEEMGLVENETAASSEKRDAVNDTETERRPLSYYL